MFGRAKLPRITGFCGKPRRPVEILNPLRDVRHALHRREVQAERPSRPEKICAVIRRQVVKRPRGERQFARRHVRHDHGVESAPAVRRGVGFDAPRPSVRGRAAVARIAASPSARSGAAWPPAPVGGRATVAAQHAGGRFPGWVRLAGELGPKPDGGDGQRGVVNLGGPAPCVQARQRAEVGPSGVAADRGVGRARPGRPGLYER